MAVNVVITPGGLFKRQFALQDLLMQGMSFSFTRAHKVEI